MDKVRNGAEQAVGVPEVRVSSGQWQYCGCRGPQTSPLLLTPRGSPVTEVSCSHAFLGSGLCSSRCWAAVAILRVWRPLFLLVVAAAGSSSPVVPLGEGVGLGSGRVGMPVCGVLGCWRGLAMGRWTTVYPRFPLFVAPCSLSRLLMVGLEFA